MSADAARPHPFVEERRRHRPARVADEHVGFNGRLVVFITRLVGTMWAVYAITACILAWMALGSRRCSCSVISFASSSARSDVHAGNPVIACS